MLRATLGPRQAAKFQIQMMWIVVPSLWRSTTKLPITYDPAALRIVTRRANIGQYGIPVIVPDEYEATVVSFSLIQRTGTF